jgi:hypothetical protein
MYTFCPRCKTSLRIDQYESDEKCRRCGFHFDRTSYMVVTALSFLFGAIPWFLTQPEQQGLARAISVAALTFAGVNIAGNVFLQRLSVPRTSRRRVLPWISTILSLLVAKALS